MAKNQEGQRTQGQSPQQSEDVRDDRTTGRSNSEAEAASSAASAGAGGGAGGGQSPEQRGDRERQVERSREGGSAGSQSAGTGAQQSPARQSSRGGGVSGRGQSEPSILPALMANPGLMTRAFMANPFAFADAMSQEMDRLFSMGGDLATPGRQSGGGAARGRGMTQWIPAMEVRQRENEIVVHADLPGLTPDDVQIELENGVLTISGERRDSSEDRHEGYVRSERSYGAFSRSIALPEGVDEDQVNARFEHGVLEVTVPLPQQQQQSRRRVPINAGGPRQAGQEREAQPKSPPQRG